MAPVVYVVNASPLIVFQRIGQFGLLGALLTHAFAPSAVRYEVYGNKPMPEWIEERPLAQSLASRIVAARLGAGEREAIALALEIGADELVLDDLAARRLARSLEINLIGSVGLLLRAKARGLIPSVRPLLEAMQAKDFRISARVLERILCAAGEI